MKENMKKDTFAHIPKDHTASKILQWWADAVVVPMKKTKNCFHEP